MYKTSQNPAQFGLIRKFQLSLSILSEGIPADIMCFSEHHIIHLQHPYDAFYPHHSSGISVSLTPRSRGFGPGSFR